MKVLMTIEDLKKFLIANPDINIDELEEYNDFVAFWSGRLSNGGENFSQETSREIIKFLKNRSKPQP